ncbi:MAG TPA: hypothetical protein PKE46_00405, partial [Micropruina sp.]|nr:hypothetical protein [Micropruina sp.]HMR20571.1 hypothetical protein [Micropruina sp.]
MDPIVVLDAAMTLAAARSAMTSIGSTAMVVVRRLHPRATGEVLWYPLTESDRERVMAPGLDPDMPL